MTELFIYQVQLNTEISSKQPMGVRVYVVAFTEKDAKLLATPVFSHHLGRQLSPEYLTVTGVMPLIYAAVSKPSKTGLEYDIGRYMKQTVHFDTDAYLDHKMSMTEHEFKTLYEGKWVSPEDEFKALYEGKWVSPEDEDV